MCANFINIRKLRYELAIFFTFIITLTVFTTSVMIAFGIETVYAATDATESLTLNVDAKSSIMLEPSTGKILYENNADEKLAPASVTKVMTILLIYESIANGNISWDDSVTISEHAANMGGSQIFLEPFEIQPVKALVKSIVIASANDAAVAMAEFISGSEESFVDLMNKKALDLGCKNTQFKNACGLDEDGHYTSARDMAIISREIINKYPEVFEFTTVWQDTIVHKTKRGEEEFGLTNTNKLVKWYDGATGLKTGSTGKALYCLVGTAEKNGLKLISVVLGAPTPNIRFQEVMKMFDYGYANYKTVEGMETGTEVGTVMIGKGVVQESPVVIKDKISAIISKTSSSELTHIVNIDESIEAPVEAGTKVGEVIYTHNGEEVGRTDAVIAESIDKASLSDMLKKLGELWFK